MVCRLFESKSLLAPTMTYHHLDHWEYTLLAKIWNIWRVQWKHSYLTFWFDGNALAATIYKYCDFDANLMCSVMDKRCHFEWPKLKTHGNVSIFNTSRNLLGYPALHYVDMKILYVCDLSPDNNLSAKTKRQKGFTINHIKFRTMCLLISINMIYTNETDFRLDTKWQVTAHSVTQLSAI